MQIPQNAFKANLNKKTQYGLWVSLADGTAAEISASAGFDWILIDAEHSANDLQTIQRQLQAAYGYEVTPIVRPRYGDPSVIKQYLDIGTQTILVPLVETKEQAQLMVDAVRYPPVGIRGVAGGRASRWGRVENYYELADEQMCVIVQIETRKGIENLDEICSVPGLDGIFIGPSDLAASLGKIGKAKDPEVRAAVCDAIKRVREHGLAAGMLSVDLDLAREYRDAGANFVGVGVDTAILSKATAELASTFASETA